MKTNYIITLTNEINGLKKIVFSSPSKRTAMAMAREYASELESWYKFTIGDDYLDEPDIYGDKYLQVKYDGERYYSYRITIAEVPVVSKPEDFIYVNLIEI